MEFLDNTFDLVFSSTMFVQITDDILSEKISTEMLRVAKPHGYIILSDWRYSKPGNLHYKALSKKRISQLFCVRSRSEVCGVYKGALLPPLGRFLSSKKMSFAYFGLQLIFPFLVGQVTTVLQKK
jgi:ubiquinone/menaquinone biosynthesis C-methylase UbiE